MRHIPISLHSFKAKLVISLLTIGLIPLIATSVFYQNILSRRITQDIESASIDKLRYTSFNIQRQLEISDQLLGWITYNTQLKHILTENYKETYEKQLDMIEFSSYVLEYAINANVESNIFKILIVDKNGDSFQIGNGMSLLDKNAIVAEDWIETYQHSRPDQLILSKDIYVKDTYIFPVSSRIYSSTTGQHIGWCLITFQNNMYRNSLKSGSDNGSVYLVNTNGQCIGNVDSGLIGADLTADEVVGQILASQDSMGHVTSAREGVPLIAHYYRVPDSNIIEIQETPLDSFLQEEEDMLRLSVMMICFSILLILCVTIYLSQVLTRPIHTISNYIKNVSKGDFKGSLTLRNHDEFKVIADSINSMEGEILDLMKKQQQEAESKKDLEFRVLQNQINPHFLYNTLNTIKWMAILQHADTIRDMTAALGRLLQNISKGSDKISIYEEMSLLDDYVLIQDVKYDGRLKVEYHIGDDQITQALILKFLFQPIVENAIFHGIEPKGDGAGEIHIYLNQVDGNIHIHIVDNGIGMTPEQIRKILAADEDRQNKRGLNGIGISNINERIKLTYGQEYGVSITSEPGAYTDVLICIPYERGELP